MPENNGFWRKAGVIVTIIIIISATVFGYAIFCGQVETNKDNIIELKESGKMAGAERRQTNDAVIRLQSDVDYIKSGIDDIKKELRNN